MHTPQHHSDDWNGKSSRLGNHYGDTLAQLDDSVGQVITAVDEAGLGNDTIIFLSESLEQQPRCQRAQTPSS